MEPRLASVSPHQPLVRVRCRLTVGNGFPEDSLAHVRNGDDERCGSIPVLRYDAHRIGSVEHDVSSDGNGAPDLPGLCGPFVEEVEYLHGLGVLAEPGEGVEEAILALIAHVDAKGEEVAILRD